MGWLAAQQVAPWISPSPRTSSRSRTSVGKLCAQFDGKYWLKKDKEGGFPDDFHRAFADAGWLGICIPRSTAGRVSA